LAIHLSHTPKYWGKRTSAFQDSDNKQKTYLRIKFIYPYLAYELDLRYWNGN